MGKFINGNQKKISNLKEHLQRVTYLELFKDDGHKI